MTDDPRTPFLDELRRAGESADGWFDIRDVAFALGALGRYGRGEDDWQIDDYRRHVSDLSAAVLSQADGAATAADRARLLIDVLAERFGYRGDTETYEDLKNANLLDVIDRRRGLPVALGVLYIAVARSCGWSMAGVNFPSHFLIRLDAHGERVLLDPFAARSLNGREELRRLLHKIAGPDTALTEQHEAAANDRTVLLRLANNIKLRLLGEHRAEAALEVLEHMLLFAPNVAALWHEAGIVEAHLGHIKAATRRLHAFQVRATDDKARAHAERLLSELRNKLN